MGPGKHSASVKVLNTKTKLSYNNETNEVINTEETIVNRYSAKKSITEQVFERQQKEKRQMDLAKKLNVSDTIHEEDEDNWDKQGF